MITMPPALALGLFLLAGGCTPAGSQTCPREVAAPPSQGAGDVSAPSGVTAEAEAGGTAASDAGDQTPRPSTPPTAPGAPPPGVAGGQGSLPELVLSLIGMHIGGGPNDEATKRPFIATITGGFDAMRACYRLAEQPEKGGTFGVDLRVEARGGAPTVQSVRTTMKGTEFGNCVTQAMTGLTFPKPERGTTVLSASVRFSLKE